MASSQLARNVQPQTRIQSDAHTSADPTIAGQDSDEEPVQWKAGTRELVILTTMSILSVVIAGGSHARLHSILCSNL